MADIAPPNKPLELTRRGESIAACAMLDGQKTAGVPSMTRKRMRWALARLWQ